MRPGTERPTSPHQPTSPNASTSGPSASDAIASGAKPGSTRKIGTGSSPTIPRRNGQPSRIPPMTLAQPATAADLEPIRGAGAPSAVTACGDNDTSAV